jgi:hypothetical protein
MCKIYRELQLEYWLGFDSRCLDVNRQPNYDIIYNGSYYRKSKDNVNLHVCTPLVFSLLEASRGRSRVVASDQDINNKRHIIDRFIGKLTRAIEADSSTASQTSHHPYRYITTVLFIWLWSFVWFRNLLLGSIRHITIIIYIY